MDMLTSFFSIQNLMPHGYCLIWNPLLLAGHVVGDFIIFLAYMIIPAGIYHFSRKRPDLKIGNIYTLFYAFILLCGMTHLISIIVLWKPIYGIEGIFKLITSIVSITTAIAVWKIMPILIKIPSFEQLENKNKEIEQFIYTASHDLKQPIRNIASYISFLKLDYKDKLDTEGYEHINNMESSINRMNEMIGDLLTYSRVGHNIEIEVINLNEVLTNVCQDLENQLKNSKATINIVNGLPTVMAHKNSMQSLFQNLIDNAIKYAIPNKNPIINISCSQNKYDYIIKFQDNGIGVSKENQEKMFVLFQRINNQTNNEGSGIGLAHCKKILQAHNGSIEIESEPEKGSTFIIKLPILKLN